MFARLRGCTSRPLKQTIDNGDKWAAVLSPEHMHSTDKHISLSVKYINSICGCYNMTLTLLVYQFLDYDCECTLYSFSKNLSVKSKKKQQTCRYQMAVKFYTKWAAGKTLRVMQTGSNGCRKKMLYFTCANNLAVILLCSSLPAARQWIKIASSCDYFKSRIFFILS